MNEIGLIKGKGILIVIFLEFCCYLHFLTEIFKNSYDISFHETFQPAKTDGSGISAEKFRLEFWSGKQTALP